MLPFFLKGLLIGFAIAAPVGPIGVLCIRRTLADGRLVGFLSGLGAATADMFYGTMAALGITALQQLLLRQQGWLRLIGGAALIYLGLRTFFSAPSTQAAQAAGKAKRFAAYLSTLGLTLSNPATILSFTAVFVGLRLGETPGNYSAAAFMVLGVFLGSASWWLFLSTLVGFFRDRSTLAWMRWVNRLAGIILLGFGIVALLML